MRTNDFQAYANNTSKEAWLTSVQVGEDTSQKTMKKVKSLPRHLNQPPEVLKPSPSCAALNDTFSQSLINRIRCVSRRNNEETELTKLNTGGLYGDSKLVKSKCNIQNIKEHIFKTKVNPKVPPLKFNNHDDQDTIATLQATIQKQQLKNQELLAQIQRYQCQIFIYKQQIELLNEQIVEKDKGLQKSKERQQEFHNELTFVLSNQQNLQLKYQELCEEIQAKDQIIQELFTKNTSQNFSISLEVSQQVISVPSADKIALLKANSELASTKKQIQLLEKSYEQRINVLKRQKDGQMEKMRQKFARNLNHYKQMIMKFTTKSSGSKFRQSLLESTLTENSSVQQI